MRFLLWCTQQESNLHRGLRKPVFYPLNYGCMMKKNPQCAEIFTPIKRLDLQPHNAGHAVAERLFFTVQIFLQII